MLKQSEVVEANTQPRDVILLTDRSLCFCVPMTLVHIHGMLHALSQPYTLLPANMQAPHW